MNLRQLPVAAFLAFSMSGCAAATLPSPVASVPVPATSIEPVRDGVPPWVGEPYKPRTVELEGNRWAVTLTGSKADTVSLHLVNAGQETAVFSPQVVVCSTDPASASRWTFTSDECGFDAGVAARTPGLVTGPVSVAPGGVLDAVVPIDTGGKKPVLVALRDLSTENPDPSVAWPLT